MLQDDLFLLAVNTLPGKYGPFMKPSEQVSSFLVLYFLVFVTLFIEAPLLFLLSVHFTDRTSFVTS